MDGSKEVSSKEVKSAGQKAFNDLEDRSTNYLVNLAQKHDLPVPTKGSVGENKEALVVTLKEFSKDVYPKKQRVFSLTVDKDNNYKVVIKFKGGNALVVNLGPISMSKLIGEWNGVCYNRSSENRMTNVELRKWGGGIVSFSYDDVQHIEYEQHRGLGPDAADTKIFAKYDRIECDNDYIS